jgi:hypothetical protein
MQEDWMIFVTFALKNEIYYRHKIITNIKNEKIIFLKLIIRRKGQMDIMI